MTRAPQQKTEVFATASIPRAVAVLAVPTVVSQLIMTVYNMADTFWVGKLNDPDQLAAITLALPVQLCLTALANLFGMGGGAVASRLLGAGEQARAKKVCACTLYWGLAVTLVCALTASALRGPLMRLLGSTPATDGYLSQYLFWVLTFGALPSVFNMMVAHFIRAEGSSRAASFGLTLGGLLNMVLDPFFILPFGLGLELWGGALATFLSNCVGSGYFIWLLWRSRNTTALCYSPRAFSLRGGELGTVLSTGLPSALQMLLSSVSNMVLNHVIVGYGERAAAALGICKKVDSIPAYTLMGITQGAVPLVAYNYGAKNRRRTEQAIHFTLGTCLVTAAVFLVLCQMFPTTIATWFIEDAQTVAYGAMFIRVHSLDLPFAGVVFLMTGIFQALKRNRSATVLSTIRKGIFDIPLMYLLNIPFPLYGPVLSQPIMDAVACACALLLYARIRREMYREVQEA